MSDRDLRIQSDLARAISHLRPAAATVDAPTAPGSRATEAEAEAHLSGVPRPSHALQPLASHISGMLWYTGAVGINTTELLKSRTMNRFGVGAESLASIKANFPQRGTTLTTTGQFVEYFTLEGEGRVDIFRIDKRGSERYVCSPDAVEMAAFAPPPRDDSLCCDLISWEEEHLVDGKLKRLLVHRKGSTRAFPPHHPLIPVDYQVNPKPYTLNPKP